VNTAVLSSLCLGLVAVAAWDLTDGLQAVTARCAWAGFCLWAAALTGLLVCLVLLTVTLLAYAGLARSDSWSAATPRAAHRLLFPWLGCHALLNCALLPAGILALYTWWEAAPACSGTRPGPTACREDIAKVWAPVLGGCLLLLLLILLHSWFLVLHVAAALEKKMNPQPFVRLGSRVVWGLLDTSKGENSSAGGSLSKGSTLVSYVYP